MGKIFALSLIISSIAIFIVGIIGYFDLMSREDNTSILILGIYIIGSLCVMGLGIHEWRDDDKLKPLKEWTDDLKKR